MMEPGQEGPPARAAAVEGAGRARHTALTQGGQEEEPALPRALSASSFACGPPIGQTRRRGSQ